ncbi:MAG TPA: hypothetical protein VL201_01125 [Patescibacteria group bacterium]|jgi:hypothetical protein|nr:hypothetical protein [Patescibacteria group bacterium]
MFVFKHAVALIIALSVVSCRAMHVLNLYKVNITEEERTKLEKFGINKAVNGITISENNFQKVLVDPATQMYIMSVKENVIQHLDQESAKIQFIVKKLHNYKLAAIMKLNNENHNHNKLFTRQVFKLTFSAFAPLANGFKHSINNPNANGSSSLETAGQGAIIIMFFGSLYSFLMQDPKSFEGTLIIGGIVFPVIVLFYGFMAEK